jgi:hypothetical protein
MKVNNILIILILVSFLGCENNGLTTEFPSTYDYFPLKVGTYINFNYTISEIDNFYYSNESGDVSWVVSDSLFKSDTTKYFISGTIIGEKISFKWKDDGTGEKYDYTTTIKNEEFEFIILEYNDSLTIPHSCLDVRYLNQPDYWTFRIPRYLPEINDTVKVIDEKWNKLYLLRNLGLDHSVITFGGHHHWTTTLIRIY